jgi:hypothetical protein
MEVLQIDNRLAVASSAFNQSIDWARRYDWAHWHQKLFLSDRSLLALAGFSFLFLVETNARHSMASDAAAPNVSNNPLVCYWDTKLSIA